MEYDRSGTTLAEVLMSLLIMSIGVVTLASLFPISILRAVQATQLTNAAILRYNAEALITALPQLVHDPDGDSDLVEHFRRPADRDYIVDPLGWELMRQLGVPATVPDTFGNDGASPPNPVGNLKRWNGIHDPTQPVPANFESTVDRLATLPDSWVVQADSAEATVGTTSVTLPADVEVVIPTHWDDGGSRIHIFDVTGKFSHARMISGVAGQVVSWTNTNPIPASFTGSPRAVRIETRERRYTWMLTVRKQGDGKANVDVVVFFRRPFEVEDEQVYTANFLRLGADMKAGVAGSDDDGNGIVDGEVVNGTFIVDSAEIGWPGSDDWKVQISWSGDRPFMKRGGYVLDAKNARWYRIQDILEDTGTSTSAVLVLDRAIIQNGNGGAIMMRGIIEVYPIGKKSL